MSASPDRRSASPPRETKEAPSPSRSRSPSHSPPSPPRAAREPHHHRRGGGRNNKFQQRGPRIALLSNLPEDTTLVDLRTFVNKVLASGDRGRAGSYTDVERMALWREGAGMQAAAKFRSPAVLRVFQSRLHETPDLGLMTSTAYGGPPQMVFVSRMNFQGYRKLEADIEAGCFPPERQFGFYVRYTGYRGGGRRGRRGHHEARSLSPSPYRRRPRSPSPYRRDRDRRYRRRSASPSTSDSMPRRRRYREDERRRRGTSPPRMSRRKRRSDYTSSSERSDRGGAWGGERARHASPPRRRSRRSLSPPRRHDGEGGGDAAGAGGLSAGVAPYHPSTGYEGDTPYYAQAYHQLPGTSVGTTAGVPAGMSSGFGMGGDHPKTQLENVGQSFEDV